MSDTEYPPDDTGEAKTSEGPSIIEEPDDGSQDAPVNEGPLIIEESDDDSNNEYDSELQNLVDEAEKRRSENKSASTPDGPSNEPSEPTNTSDVPAHEDIPDLDQEIHRILKSRLAGSSDSDPFSDTNKTKSITTLGSRVKNCDLSMRELTSLLKSDWVEDSILDFYAQLVLMHTKMDFVCILSAQYSVG